MEEKKKDYISKQTVPLYLVLIKLDELSRKIKSNLHFLIDAIRSEWIKNLLSKKENKELLQICKATGVDLPKPNKRLYKIAVRYGLTKEAWRYDENFVLNYRFHLPIKGIYQPHLAPVYDLFFRLFGKFYKGKKKEIKKVLENFDLSIRPINLCSSIVNSEAIKNFLPEIGQKFTKDPFGIQRREHLVLDKMRGKLIYLATRKKEHGTYLTILNVVAYCTAGCARCYRGEQTRELKTFTAINPDESEEIVYFLSPAEQVKRLIKKWNQEKEPPEDILFSGGEPMNIKIEEWIKIIKELKKAKHLKFFRICTGDLFLGQPFRLIDERFLKAIEEFHKETGKSIKFACNLPHPKFITPEVVYVIMKLHKLGIGIEIQTQTPLEEGILCFQKTIQQKIKSFEKKKLSDEEIIDAWAPSLAKSFNLLKELCVKISMLSDRPYKFIHDMQQSVSVIYNLVLYSLLSEPHIGTTDSSIRPTSFALFAPHLPNLNLSFHSLQYIAKVENAYFKNDDKIKIVLPHSVGAIVEYEEPYFSGINDLEIIKKLADIEFWNKLKKRVKELI